MYFTNRPKLLALVEGNMAMRNAVAGVVNGIWKEKGIFGRAERVAGM